MVLHRHIASPWNAFRSLLLVACVALLSLLSASGCKNHSHTSDSRLQKIDEMLNSKLPPGTPMSRVDHFLKSRGYVVEDSPDKNSLVAVVRHVDTDTLQPVTARVTFHFDSNTNLISYELQPAPDAPLRP
jgi:ATP-dependent 26S proteasome regulatory subunit